MVSPKRKSINIKGKTFELKKLNATEKRFLAHSNAVYLSEKIPTDFKVLGLDLAKYKTGYTILEVETRNEKQQSHHIETGIINCSASLTTQKSVNDFYNQITALIIKHKPDLIAYEYIAVATEITGFKALAKVEAALQIALNQIYSEAPLLLPLSVKTVKKMALWGEEPDKIRARLLAEQLGITRQLTKKDLDKLSIMVATKDRFGMDFKDDNECDSFLVANCALAISSFLCDILMAGQLAEFDDKSYMKYIKAKINDPKPLFAVSNQIGASFVASTFPIKENDIGQHKATVKEIRRRFYNILEDADIEDDDDDVGTDD